MIRYCPVTISIFIHTNFNKNKSIYQKTEGVLYYKIDENEKQFKSRLIV